MDILYFVSRSIWVLDSAVYGLDLGELLGGKTKVRNDESREL